MNEPAPSHAANNPELLNADDVRAAAQRIAGAVVRTPTVTRPAGMPNTSM